MSKVGLVTADPASSGEVDLDLPPLVAALTDAGVVVETPDWRDTNVDWMAFDLLVIRSTWDYSLYPEQFPAWLTSVADHTRVLNCPAVIAWSLNKRYLGALAQRGIPVVPTAFAADQGSLDVALAEVTAASVVIKPTVSAGSRDTGLFVSDDPAARSLGQQIIAMGKTVMIQPAIPSVAERGETALILIDGQVSHAVTKGPLLAAGGGLIGGEYAEVISAANPTGQEWDLAKATVEAAVEAIGPRGCCADQSLLYARIDIVAGLGGEPLVLEAELFEPSLFVEQAPESARRFAEAVIRRLPS